VLVIPLALPERALRRDAATRTRGEADAPSRIQFRAGALRPAKRRRDVPIHPKPGNEPDAQDMSPEFDPAAEVHAAPSTDSMLAEEEEAAKLGDFA